VPLDGYEELFRKLYQTISPITTLSAFRTRIAAFAIADDNEKANQIARLIGTLIESREAVFFVDHGGLLGDRGEFPVHLRNTLLKLPRNKRPSIIFIAERMVPGNVRSDLGDVIFCSLSSLARNEVRQLAALLLKQSNISYSNDDLEQILDLSDGHPFNIIFIVQAAKQYSLPVFLADPSALLSWKRRRASEFIQKIEFSDGERTALCALKDFNALDFDTLSLIFDSNAALLGQALSRLIELHIVEAKSDLYLISPPLKAAIDRDPRFGLSQAAYKKMLEIVSGALRVQTEDSAISASLVNAGILAQLQQTGEVSPLFSSFLLPSHLVWLARKRYNDRQFEECIRLANSALASKARLSKQGLIEACRWLCLAAARLGTEERFLQGVSVLKSEARDAHARSNLNFLLGFNARLKRKSS
jgi:hypothetical protein